jgi:hypothetical protein
MKRLHATSSFPQGPKIAKCFNENLDLQYTLVYLLK